MLIIGIFAQVCDNMVRTNIHKVSVSVTTHDSPNVAILRFTHNVFLYKIYTYVCKSSESENKALIIRKHNYN